MSIKEQVEQLIGAMNERETLENKIDIASRIVELHAALSDDKNEVGLEVFESMRPDARRMALIGFLQLIAASLE